MTANTLLRALLLSIAWLALWRSCAPAAEPPLNAGGVHGLDLKTQLEKGLKARRPVEFEYIAEINKLVEEGKLPRSLVTSTFGWARKKQTRQLQYFQFALQTRARGLDVQLPDLRKQAVGIGSNGGEHGVNTPPGATAGTRVPTPDPFILTPKAF